MNSSNRGTAVAQWIRPQTLNREVPGSILLAAAECEKNSRFFLCQCKRL